METYGEKDIFAVEYEFTSSLSGKTNGYVNLWINGINICKYNRNQQYEGDLYDLTDWFCGKIEYILGHDMFPLPVTGNSALELIENANKFESDSTLEVDLWYAAKSRWVFNHCWFVARGGAVLPCVYFRRVENFIEISWDNEFWERKNIVFSSQKDVCMVEFDIFAGVIKKFLFSIISVLEKKMDNKEKIEELKREIGILD